MSRRKLHIVWCFAYCVANGMVVGYIGGDGDGYRATKLVGERIGGKFSTVKDARAAVEDWIKSLKSN